MNISVRHIVIVSTTRFTLRITALLKIIMASFLLAVLPSLIYAQKENQLLRKGNNLYEQGNYKDAERDYRKALELNNESTRGQFNLGTAIYKQKNYDESAKIFGSLSDSKIDPKIKANALHNLGNSFIESKQYDKSIQAYENSLLNNPKDKDTKYNLEYAKMMLKKQQEQQKQNDKNKQNKDQKDKKDKQDQNKDQQNKDQSQNKSQQDQNKKISKEDAERMLEALKNNEKKTLVKVNKEKNKDNQQLIIEKDW
jgi:Ca-activated chloride channel family protein